MDEITARRMNETMADMEARFNPAATQEKRGRGRPKKDVVKEMNEREKQMYFQTMLVIMRNFDVRSPAQVRSCLPCVEEVMKVIAEKFGEE